MLLDDIIALAADDKHSITALLRKCLVLAHELKNEHLQSWATQELNGYTSTKNLPEYRTMLAQAMGTFVNPAYKLTRNIPPVLMEKDHRWAAESVNLVEPVKAYESMVEAPGRGPSIMYQWSGDMVLYYQDQLLDEYTLMSAWQEVPISAISAVLDSIRTRVLNMALEIKAAVGESDADLTGITPDSQEANKVDQTINNNIFGGTNYFATGQSHMNATTVQQNIVAGDWEQLKKVLRSSGLADSEVEELSEAVKDDGGSMGSRVKGWISKNGVKVLSGGVKIGAAVGQSVLTAYLKQHFNLDQ